MKKKISFKIKKSKPRAPIITSMVIKDKTKYTRKVKHKGK